mmetsp:Transcript_25072/g.72136  ORF Transcript_25072/g.72136 Transcript_25072/m.72136 type:complete len:83 (-) Transcript_25072:886-1134(-)
MRTHSGWSMGVQYHIILSNSEYSMCWLSGVMSASSNTSEHAVMYEGLAVKLKIGIVVVVVVVDVVVVVEVKVVVVVLLVVVV